MILVSVIIPTYNYKNFICEAIESVLNQNYQAGDVEIIVVDDGSTDNTQSVLQPYIDKKLIQYYFQENKGKAEATVVAINNCKGKYIFNLDADDYFLPGKIDQTVKIFESDEDIVHVASPADFFYAETQISEREQIPSVILEKPVDGNWLLDYFYKNNLLFGGGTTYAARADKLKSINIPPEVDMYIDEFLILTILPKGKSYFITTPLSVWRVHKSNYSGTTASKDQQIKKGLRLINSSKALLAYLRKNNFSNNLVNIYYLIDEIRWITYKESINRKNFTDVLKYLYILIFRIRPDFNLIKKYNILNRLVPSFILINLKKIKQKKAA